MILNDLISSLINCERKAVNDFRLHFDNGTDGIENEAGYTVIERPSNPIGFDMSLVFDQVNSSLRYRHSAWQNTLRNRH